MKKMGNHTTYRSLLAVAAIALTFVTSLGAQRAEEKPLYMDSSQPIEKRVEDLLSRMTLEEKIAMVHADSKFTVAAIPRLGIPKRWLSDGPHGVREDVGPYTWQAAGRTDDFATWMPSLTALSSTWNTDRAHDFGMVIGEEARKRGKDIMLGPGVNIMRTPLCGRNFEYFGEDPFLAGHMAAPYIRAVQSNDVASCVKHFVANNQEWERFTIDVQMDERALREIYLPAFKTAIDEGGVLTVMGAYNKFRGEHCCHNDYLLNKILKQEWGFKGLVMSDWDGTHDTHQAVMNGLDLEMGTNRDNYDEFYLAGPFLEGIRKGEYPMSILDDKVRRNLRVMFATKTFEQRPEGSINTAEHQAAARRIAEEGIVLLKNDSNALPLDAAKVSSVAVIGENATRLQAHSGGSSRIKAFYEITPLEGILRRVGATANVSYSVGYAETAAPDAIERAVQAAKQADVAIVVGGLNHSKFFDAEADDRKDMKLPYNQDELIRRVVEANPRTIVVMFGGGPVEMGPWLEKVPAVLWAWYPGMEGGNALAGILFGDVNPSGKLVCSFPKRLEDSPAHALGAYPGKDGTVRYDEGLLVGYRWYDTKKVAPLFPFGYGLSYTTFEYSNLRLVEGKDANGPALTVEFDVMNTGSRKGAEVAEVYVHDDASSLPRPEQELKGFQKVLLEPGEKRTLSVPLDRGAFAFYDPARKGWVAEQGDFTIVVGGSSRDARLRGAFRLANTSVF